MRKPPISIRPLAIGIGWALVTGLRMLNAWQSVQLIPILLTVQAGMVTYLLVVRSAEIQGTSQIRKAFAYVSFFIPLALQVKHETISGDVVSMVGLFLSLWAIWELGRSFGIAPADRGLVGIGPYRYLRHPMYLGELVALIGIVIGDPSPRNYLVWFVLLITILVRIQWEEQTIAGYADYVRQVSWRLIPGIW